MKKYDSYKDSGVKWLGEIPEHWNVKRLGAILEDISIKNQPDKPLLSITREKGVILRDLEDDSENHNFIPDDLSGYKFLKKGQFGMNKMKAWQGSYGVSNYDGIVSPAYYIFDLNSQIVPNYFHKAIRSKFYVAHFGSASDGVRIGQWDLSKSRMKEIPFFIPPPEEQQAIAEFLDEKTAKIDQAIAIKEKEIELLKERRQILIQELVTGKKIWDGNQWTKPTKTKDSGVDWIGEIPEDWKLSKLKSFCEAYGRIGFRGYTTSDLVDEGEGAITISPSNIKENDMEFEKNSFLSWEKYNESPEIKIRENDILIVKTGSTYGKIGMVKSLPQKATINPQLLVLKNIKLNVDFLYESLKSNCFKTQIEKNVIGSTIPTISESKILGFVIPVPIDKKYLTGIVDRLKNINEKYFKIISIKQQEIEKLKEYKTVLIDNVVTGKVRVT
ncbi:restriction endonuclease subunit S [Chryseobacterium sp. R2A-55]|uniref:restriction endonuclease subunit S n=1 Tax=Chryseobacterium sp. R2A-55 TaxID=2744445 RepID=UPI001F4763C6|nr:restriction endonuclease subunit S [Chryseobacterium sp. R2A-55]